MFDIQKKKKSRHAENQENITYKKEKNWTHPEQAQVLGLANKDIKAVIITISHMFEKLSGNIKDTKKSKLNV